MKHRNNKRTIIIEVMNSISEKARESNLGMFGEESLDNNDEILKKYVI